MSISWGSDVNITYRPNSTMDIPHKEIGRSLDGCQIDRLQIAVPCQYHQTRDSCIFFFLSKRQRSRRTTDFNTADIYSNTPRDDQQTNQAHSCCCDEHYHSTKNVNPPEFSPINNAVYLSRGHIYCQGYVYICFYFPVIDNTLKYNVISGLGVGGGHETNQREYTPRPTIQHKGMNINYNLTQ